MYPNLSIDDLPEDVRELITNLREEGVRALVDGNKDTQAYRNTRLTSGERIGLIEQLARLGDMENGGTWAAKGEDLGDPYVQADYDASTKIGDSPADWLNHELSYLDEE